MSDLAFPAEVVFDAIGTSWQIDTDTPLAPELIQRVRDRIEAFDATWSRFHARSLVARMAAASTGGAFTFSEEAVDLFALYDRLHQATAGAVDPLVGGDLERLGYDAGYSLVPVAHAPNVDRPSWSSDVKRKGATLTSTRPLVLDVGAAGKGLLADIVANLLIDAGTRAVTVDAGGDIRKCGGEPTRIGLEHPFDPNLAVGVTALVDGALCASAVGRRAWGEWHHILDGRTGEPTRAVLATWVKAKTAMLADGLATALFFASPERLADEFSFSHARMFADGRAEMSVDFEGELFTA